MTDIITEEDIEKCHLTETWKKLKKGICFIVQRVIKRKDNTLINVSTNAKLLDNGNVMAIIREITRKEES